MVASADYAYADRVLPSIRGKVKNQVRGGLVEVARLLEKMKELGRYDDATIVLQADHGPG
jgi:arylsulfatase A-like enzyme